MTSLLDAIVEKKAHNSESKSMIFSLVYVSRLSGGSMERKTIGSHYEQLAKECQNRYQVDGPTGLLLVYPMHCVHILEATHEMVLAVIRDLHEMSSINGYLSETKLLSVASNVSRLYSQWSYRVLNIPVISKGEMYETSSPLEDVVSSTLDNLYQLGTQLAKLSQTELKRYLDDLKRTALNLLPRQDMLEYFLSNSEMTTPTDYLAMYMKPLNITLESEVVWPLPLRLFPYN